MVYNVNDQKQYIRLLQSYLYTLSETKYPTITKVSITGKIDNTTRCAITDFQTITGLLPTCKVNYETFNLIYKEYMSANNTDRTFVPLKLNDRSSEVARLNADITELSADYSELTRLSGDYYTYHTERCVNYLKRVFMMEENGICDFEFLSRLRLELSMRNNYHNNR